MTQKLKDLQVEELINIEDLAPDYVYAPSLDKDEKDEEVPVREYFELYEDTVAEVDALPYLIDAYKYLLADVKDLSKGLTLDYVTAEGDEEQKLRDVVSALLEYQGWLEGQIERVEDQLVVVIEEDKKYKLYLERLELIKSHQEEIDKLNQLNAKDGFIHNGRRGPSTPRPKRPQRKQVPHPVKDKNGDEIEFKTWKDKAEEKTKSATSTALGSTIGFLEKMKKKLPEKETRVEEKEEVDE